MDMGKILRAAVSLEYQKWMECRYHGIDPMRLVDIHHLRATGKPSRYLLALVFPSGDRDC